MKKENEKQNKEHEMWFETAVAAIADPYQEAKPKLSQNEIENAAKVYKTFVDPRYQGLLYHVLRRKCHKDTFNKWWVLVCGHNINPVDHPYSVDEYIVDKGIGKKNCQNEGCYCGACYED